MPDSRRPPDPDAIIDELLGGIRGRTFNTMADVQRELAARTRAYNAQPQRELGGLSPTQLYGLLHGDWSTGAFTVNDALVLESAEYPEMLHNARTLLTTLRDEGPAKMTAGGNLSRQFVGLMLPRLRWPAGYLEDVRRMNKVIDERDVPPLEILRYVLQFARLIHKRKGFHISPAGRAMLDDARRGELLALLFRTFFRELDLRTVGGYTEDAQLQHTIAFTFWKIGKETRTWTKPAHLVKVAWLEHAKDPVLPPFQADDRVWTLRRRVLDPLVSLGLLEARALETGDRWERLIEVRKTPLFDRLLQFDIR